MHELWAGVLILLSILAYGGKRPAWGAAAGFAALLIRELAAPYCMLCFVLAVKHRRRREVGFWLVAAALYALSYLAHIAQVLPRIAPDAHAHAGGWLCFGGAPFVISTAQMNGFLLLLPQSVTAVFLACAWWVSRDGVRLGVSGPGSPPAFIWRCSRRSGSPSISIGARSRPRCSPWAPCMSPAAVSTLWRRESRSGRSCNSACRLRQTVREPSVSWPGRTSPLAPKVEAASKGSGVDFAR